MSSPISVLLDTMGIEDLCAKYYISLRQSLFMGSLYLILIGNLLLLILTTALQKVRKCTHIVEISEFFLSLISENLVVLKLPFFPYLGSELCYFGKLQPEKK